jgi:succinate-semialdehyde dehydrogenase/glutarate-semialdehyde dehydrogenase
MPNPIYQPLQQPGHPHLREDSDEKINEVLETAGDTFDFWKETTFAHRKELMWATADVLDRNAGEYARLMTLEMGKPIKDAVAE